MPNHPTTNRRLLGLLDALPLPCTVRMGLLGLTYQERGKLATTATDEWASPSAAILAQVLTEHPHLQVPACYPSVPEFAEACRDVEPFMNRLSVRLGREQTFISRAIRADDRPNAAPWTLMALVCNPANGDVTSLWRTVEGAALSEARSRGILDLDALGRWPRHHEMA